ncbi:MAG: hypothetical protein KBC27_01325 [Rickettsiales bacterium]|nr:hypothetical protein [Rickettsiales bacterium]
MAVINYHRELSKLIKSGEYLFGNTKASGGDLFRTFLFDNTYDTYTTAGTTLLTTPVSIAQSTALLTSHDETDLDLVVANADDIKTFVKTNWLAQYSAVKTAFDALFTTVGAGNTPTADQAAQLNQLKADLLRTLDSIETTLKYQNGDLAAYKDTDGTGAYKTFNDIAAFSSSSTLPGTNPTTALHGVVHTASSSQSLFDYIYRNAVSYIYKALYQDALADFNTLFTTIGASTEPTAPQATQLNAKAVQLQNILTALNTFSGIDTNDVAAYTDGAAGVYDTFPATTYATGGAADLEATNPSIALDASVQSTFFEKDHYNDITLFPEAFEKLQTYLAAAATLTVDGSTTLATPLITSLNTARSDFNTKALLIQDDHYVLDVSTYDIRSAVLLLEKSDLTTSEWRALINIILALDIGNIDEVSLDGSTYKTIAGTIGTDALTTSVKTSLAAAINTAGNVGTLDINGDSTVETDFASTIGTASLTASDKTSLVDALNAIATRSDNIITTGLTGFYGCTSGLQDATISLPTGTTEAELYDKVAQCIKYSASTNDLGRATVSGGECTDITSRGDALAYCIGSIMTVAEYS